MGHGVFNAFTVTMASGGTLTGSLDLARAWGAVYLEVPSMNSNSQIHIHAARRQHDGTAGTFRRITHPSINSSTVTTNDFAIVSAATNRMVPIPNGARLIKIETTATCDNGETFRVLCSDF